jgi:hypothetical protein
VDFSRRDRVAAVGDACALIASSAKCGCSDVLARIVVRLVPDSVDFFAK